ncbi:hypothetical protein D918_07379 [Trichuris suis]|nr:hypothetical protein D918_07379 [Trichuris suis]
MDKAFIGPTAQFGLSLRSEIIDPDEFERSCPKIAWRKNSSVSDRGLLAQCRRMEKPHCSQLLATVTAKLKIASAACTP